MAARDPRSPQVQLQLCIQEVDQRPPGHDLRMAVVDHQPLVIDVLAADALGPRGQDDDLGLPDVQAWWTEEASEPCGHCPPRGAVGLLSTSPGTAAPAPLHPSLKFTCK